MRNENIKANQMGQDNQANQETVFKNSTAIVHITAAIYNLFIITLHLETCSSSAFDPIFLVY